MRKYHGIKVDIELERPVLVQYRGKRYLAESVTLTLLRGGHRDSLTTDKLTLYRGSERVQAPIAEVKG